MDMKAGSFRHAGYYGYDLSGTADPAAISVFTLYFGQTNVYVAQLNSRWVGFTVWAVVLGFYGVENVL